MISTNKRRLYGEVYNDVRCLSTDEKPTDVKNGSTLVEIDTGDVYMFDAEGVTWNQLPSSGGGGGGPQPASVVPLMDGVANAGSSEKYARADHIHPTDTSRASTAVATTSANGLMSATDKRKLGGIESGANAYTLPTMSASTKGGAKLGDGLTITDGALGIDPEPQESTGAVRGAVSSLTAKGWATQTQTTGKNLAKPNPDISDGSFTNVVCTYLGNGVWRMVGANNVDSANTRSFKMFDLGVLPAGTYCVTFEMVSGTSDSNIIARLGTGSNATYYSNITNVVATPTKNVRTFTADGSNQYWVCMQLSARATVDGVFRLQVESGSTSTDYEPYSGGAPSPSPDWPQKIQVARGRNLYSQDVEGYHAHGATWTSAGVTYAKDANGIIHATGTASGSSWAYGGSSMTDNRLFVTLPAGTYVVSSSAPFVAGRKRVNGAASQLFATSAPPITFTLSEPTDVYAIPVIANGTTVNDLEIWLQTELGSTPTPYVPYGHVGVKVQGRNLLPKATSTTNNGVTFTVNDDGSITANGTVTGSNATLLLMNNARMQELPFIGEAVTLSLSGCPDGGGSSTYNIVANFTNNGSNANLADNGGGATNQYDSLGVPSTGNIYIRIYGSGRTVSNLTFRPQLEVGSTTHPYQPYLNETIPVPLSSKGFAAALPDGTADVLAIDGAGKVEWASATKMVTFDGSSDEAWAYASGTPSRVYTQLSDCKDAIDGGYAGYCDYYEIDATVINIANIRDNTILLSNKKASSSDGRLFVFDNTHATSNSGWTAWLAQNPVTVLYPLAMTTTEQVGYIDWPSIPDGATITCPELDDLGVRYLIGNGVSEMARDWYERGHAEAQATSTALGELAQSVLDVDGKADAIAAQLVAEDVSSELTVAQGPEFAPVADSTRVRAFKVLGFVWFNFEFKLAADTTLTGRNAVLYAAAGPVVPATPIAPIATSAAQTNIPKVDAVIELFGNVGMGVSLVTQESSVTIAGGDTVYSISGIYYVG